MQTAFVVCISCENIKITYQWFKHWTPSLVEGSLVLVKWLLGNFQSKITQQQEFGMENANHAQLHYCKNWVTHARQRKRSEHTKVAMAMKLVKFSQCFIQSLTQVHHLPPLLLRHFKTSLGHADHFKRTANYTS